MPPFSYQYNLYSALEREIESQRGLIGTRTSSHKAVIHDTLLMTGFRPDIEARNKLIDSRPDQGSLESLGGAFFGHFFDNQTFEIYSNDHFPVKVIVVLPSDTDRDSWLDKPFDFSENAYFYEYRPKGGFKSWGDMYQYMYQVYNHIKSQRSTPEMPMFESEFERKMYPFFSRIGVNPLLGYSSNVNTYVWEESTRWAFNILKPRGMEVMIPALDLSGDFDFPWYFGKTPKDQEFNRDFKRYVEMFRLKIQMSLLWGEKAKEAPFSRGTIFALGLNYLMINQYYFRESMAPAGSPMEEVDITNWAYGKEIVRLTMENEDVYPFFEVKSR